MEWFLKCMREYTNFNGRARRKEYWIFVLFSCVIMYVILAVGMVSSGLFDRNFILASAGDPIVLWKTILSRMWYYYAVGLVFFLPSLAATVRRLHDTGRSGWMLGLYWLVYVVIIATVISLVFLAESHYGVLVWGIYVFGIYLRGIVFMIALLVWLCLPGDTGTNRYGIDPKAANQ